MRYSPAFGLMTTKHIAVRRSVPENRIAYRFGGYVRLNPDPDARPKWISWTPTEEDMKADDWTVLDEGGNEVPAPRLTPGAAADEPPLSASGGRGEGTGWKRA